MRRNRLRTTLFLAVWVAAGLISTAVYLAPSWHVIRDYVQSTGDLERKMIDSRFSIRGKQKPPSNVVIVAVDDQSFDDLQFNWPFPRAYHAGVVNRLHKESIRIIALPEVRDRMVVEGAEFVGDTPEQFAAFLKGEIEKWGKAVKASGAKSEG